MNFSKNEQESVRVAGHRPLVCLALFLVALLAPAAAVAQTALGIDTKTLPGATAGSAYSLSLTASGGTPPYTWTAGTLTPEDSGSNGLTLSTAGLLSGTPTFTGVMPIIVQVQDSMSNTATMQYELVVGGSGSGLAITNTPPGGTQGSGYSFTFNSSWYTSEAGCNLGLKFIEGHTPAGLSMNSLNGDFSGTPVAAGEYTFTLSASGGDLCGANPHRTNSQTFTVSIALDGSGVSSPPGGSGWTRVGSTPVLQPSVSTWDEFAVRSPSVVKVGDTFYMYYEGVDSTTKQTSIGLATSTDGVAWTKSNDPVLTPGAGSAWDSFSVRYPAVHYDGFAFRMWYYGSGSGCGIGYATSVDGVVWQKNPTPNPVIGCGDFGSQYAPGSVVMRNGVFYMYTWQAIGTALNRFHSSDGVSWTNDGSLAVTLDPDNPSSLQRPVVVVDGPDYRMLLHRHRGYVLAGDSGGFDLYKSGVAYLTSADGLTWLGANTDNTAPVVLGEGQLGAWDRPAVGQPWFLKDGNTWRMWYTGGRMNIPSPGFYLFVDGSIGAATAPGEPALATIDVSPASVTFADTPVGTTRDRTIVVTNIGGGTLSGTASTAAPFSITSGASFSLGAGERQLVTVHLAPTVGGPVGGSVDFTSNGGNATRALSGTAGPPPSPPTITSFVPAVAPVGASVVINGTNLSTTSAVTFNGTAASSIVVNSNTKLTLTVPDGATSGSVMVTTAGGTISRTGFKVSPKITDVSPASVLAGSDTVVTISGSNLKVGSTTPTVKIGVLVLPATAILSSSATEVTINVPLTANAGVVAVTTTDGTAIGATLTVTHGAQINSFVPATGGPVGTLVTINGTALAGVTDVAFNGVSAGEPTIVSAAQIKATVPTGATTGRISVTNPAGTTLSVASFKVAPKITGLSPLSALPGAAVTITGLNLKVGSTTPTVKVGTLMVPTLSVTASSDTTIVFNIPLTAVSGKVSVATADGTGVSTDTLIVVRAPTVTTFTPPSAPIGAVVTINGTNLAAVIDVTFNGVSAGVPTIVSATQIKATVPSGASTGKIGVTNEAGSALSAGIFKVAPKITAVAPLSGIIDDPVTITGLNLTVGGAAPTVKIGAVVVPPASITSSSPTSIELTIPATAFTGKVTVTTTDGTGVSADTLIVIRTPAVASFTPLSAPIGAVVTINGTNLAAITDVTFNGQSAGAPTIMSATQIKATVPSGASTGKIGVTNAAGSALSVGILKVAPKIASLSPLTGIAGDAVTITGLNLKVGGSTPTVKIGAVAVPVTSSSDTTVVFGIPLTAFTGNVTVTTTDGTGTSVDTLTVIRPPTVTTFAPLAGAPEGPTVTITGTNLASVTDVTFGGVSAGAPVTATATSITAVVPAGAHTGKIGVTNPANTAQSAGTFKVLPKITDFSPMSGAAGDTITITGTTLSTGVDPIVKVGAFTAATTLVSPTSLAFTIPGPAVTGKISVTTVDGTALSGGSLAITTPLKPDVAVTSVIAPAFGVRSTKTVARTMSVTTTVTNTGPAAAGAFSIAILAIPSGGDGARVLGIRAVAGLAPGASSTAATTLTVPADLPRGTYTISAVADVAGALNELSIGNNPLNASTTTAILDNLTGSAPLRPEFSTLNFVNCGSVAGDRSFGGTLTISSQTNDQFAGTATITSPGSPSVTITAASLRGSVDVNGQITSPSLAITATAGGTATGTMTLGGSEGDGVLSLDVTGQAQVDGGTCTFTGTLIVAPATRNALSFQLAATHASFAVDALTPTVSFPIGVTGWQPQFKVDFDSPLPAASTVTFTSPAGALSGVPADDGESDIGTSSAVYRPTPVGPQFSNGSANTPPPGAWTISYKGADQAFTVADPQASTHLVIPVPTATVDDNGKLTRLTWVYKNSTTGAVLTAPPAFMSNIQVELQHDGETGYATGPLTPATRSVPVLNDIPWDCVSTVQMAYDDTLGNRYFVAFDREATGTDCGNGGGNQPPFDLAFNFTQGNFSGNTTGSTGVLTFPSPIAYYFPQFYTNAASPPASVFFTGPAGASLNPRVESSGRFSGSTTGYNGPQIGPGQNLNGGIDGSANPPAGTYGVEDVDHNSLGGPFTVPDPQSATRATLIVPTITVDGGGNLTRVDWVYKDTNGTNVGPQSFMTTVDMDVDGLVNSQVQRLFSADGLTPATTSANVTSTVVWSSVTMIQLRFRDDLGNTYTSYWSTQPPPAPTISSISPTSGVADGSTQVIITGTNFGCQGCVGGVNAVRFNGASGTTAQFTVDSATQITATVPAGAASGPIWVQSIGGTTQSADSFTVTP